MALRINFNGAIIQPPGYYGDIRDLDPTNTRIETPPLDYESREAIVDMLRALSRMIPLFTFLTFNPASGFMYKSSVMNPKDLDRLETLRVVYKMQPGVIPRD